MLVVRFEKHKLMFSINFLHATLLFFAFTISPDNLALTTIVHTLGIITFGITITLLFTMYTDCVEYGEWKTGSNSAGLTVSASMLSLKFGSAVGGALPVSFTHMTLLTVNPVLIALVALALNTQH